jgi:predicted alpha/beta hydrolase family esterase
MKRVVLIHGNGGGNGSDNWFPWVKAELEKIGAVCETPDMPDAMEAKSSIWLPYIQDVIRADENTILVGHSSGAVAAMRYAETHKLGGSVLVGTYYTDLGYEDEKAAGYFDTSWDWEAIKANQPWVMIFASTDDPYIDISEPKLIRDKLGADYHEFINQGHFGSADPAKAKLEFPELVQALKSKLQNG